MTTEPQEGELVCYYYSYSNNGSTRNLGDPVHYGVYDSNNFVKSKWGCEPTYRHPLFYVGTAYGNFIRCYRLKTNVTIEALESERYTCPTYTTPLPQEEKLFLENIQLPSFTINE